MKSGRPTLRMRSLPAGLGSGKKETSSLTVFCVRVTGGKKKVSLKKQALSGGQEKTVKRTAGYKMLPLINEKGNNLW